MTQQECAKLQVGDRVSVSFDFDGDFPEQIHIGTVLTGNAYAPTLGFKEIFDYDYYPFWSSEKHKYCWYSHYERILGYAKTPMGNTYVQNR